MATILGDKEFTEAEIKQMAGSLKNAMDGLGTNEEKIIEVLVTHTNQQRQKIKDAYAVAYGKPLIDDLVSELTGDLEETVVALMLPPRDYDAKMLKDAMSGAGTDEKTLIGIMCTSSNSEIQEIKAAYKRMYQAELIDDLQSDTSGYFGRMMYSLASAARQEGKADEHLAQEEAKKLISAGVAAWGTDESEFNAVLCLDSYEQLKLVFRKYRELRGGKDIEEDIASEMSSDLKEGYLSIVKVTKDRTSYFAERLNKAMRGWGTDDSELIRLIVSRSETDLKHVAVRYQQMYHKSLYDDVKSECGGYYKQCMLSVIAGKFVSRKE